MSSEIRISIWDSNIIGDSNIKISYSNIQFYVINKQIFEYPIFERKLYIRYFHYENPYDKSCKFLRSNNILNKQMILSFHKISLKLVERILLKFPSLASCTTIINSFVSGTLVILKNSNPPRCPLWKSQCILSYYYNKFKKKN